MIGKIQLSFKTSQSKAGKHNLNLAVFVRDTNCLKKKTKILHNFVVLV